ncbi:MAG: MFS transporter [Chloroflexi bacterium]|nr:MAG: MFS transporter [Chloroflexota bacterium]
MPLLQTAAFSYPEFRRYYAGQAVSVVGTWMQSVAISWLVLELSHNSALALALNGACQYGPVLVVGLFAGALVDRTVHRDLLLLTQVVSTLGATGLALLSASHLASLPAVYGLAALLGINQALYFPSRQATVLEMVGRADLGSALALNAMAFNLARIAGPAIAGLVIAAVGVTACFWLNAVSYAGVMLALLTIRRHPVPPPSGLSTLGLIAEGLRYVGGVPVLGGLFALLFVASVFGANFTLVLPLFTRVTLQGSADQLGYLFSAQGLGAFTGALTMAAFGRSLLRPSRVVTSGLCFGAIELLFVVSPGFWQAIALLLAIGWSFAVYSIGTNTLVQMRAPDRMQGRMVSLYSTVFIGTTPIGALFAGLVAHRFGPPAAVTAGGAVTVATAAGVLAWLYARDGGDRSDRRSTGRG